MLVVESDSASNSLSQGESRGLGCDVLELIPFVLGDMLGNKGVLGLDDGEVAWLDISSRSRSKRFGLEGLNNLEGIIDDFVDWQAASDHMSSSATVINDDKSLPGNTFFSIEDSVLLGDLPRPVSQQRNLALALQTTVSSDKASH